jgi:type IV pilus assembly protein PilW
VAPSRRSTAANLPRVRAMRMGIVTRSPQREKPDASGNCEASLAKPRLFDVEIDPDVTDWQCYRYRVSTVVVPLRNLVLGLRE